MSLKISVSWPAGSWKSALINAIVQKYNMETIDTGDVFFRQRAVARGLTVDEYDKFVELHPEEDRAIEKEVKKFIQNCPKDVVVAWRMWFHVMPDITSIWLDVSPEEWAKRIFEAGRWSDEKKYATIEDAMRSNIDRMERLKKRLFNVYQVDFTNPLNYTKIIDTTGKSFDQVLQEFEDFMKTLKK